MPKGRVLQAPDGTMIFIDTMTVKKKKNRMRHIKDGAPKKLRGAPKPFAEASNIELEVED